jgi:hypothetical protein
MARINCRSAISAKIAAAKRAYISAVIVALLHLKPG